MSSSNDAMSPDASPGTLSRRSGVRRVNNWPMYIIGGAAMLFLLIMLLVAADRAEQQSKPAEKEAEKGGNSSLHAAKLLSILLHLDFLGLFCGIGKILLWAHLGPVNFGKNAAQTNEDLLIAQQRVIGLVD